MLKSPWFSSIRLLFFALLSLFSSVASQALAHRSDSSDFKVAKSEKAEGSSEGTGEAAFFKLEKNIVISASKYAQNIIEAPSAITVLTQEDIRQSGTLDITQLFRFAPGVLVTELDSLGRDVIIRGFPQEFSPRLLVLLDGIPVYTPLFSGVTWSFLPISLPSIERIEIIRGASSTLYGANAFSGVINIITKKPGEKPSMYIYGSGGNLGLTQEEAVFNGALNDKFRFRLTGMFRRDKGDGSNNGNGQFDGQVAGQGTVDFDWDISKNSHMRFYLWGKGAQREEPFTGFLGPQNPTFQNFIGGFKFTHQFTKKQTLSFQTTYNDLNQQGFTTNPPVQIRKEVNTDLQYTNQINHRDTLVAGASFRTGGYAFLNFLPPGLQHLTLASVFVNNDFKILDNLILTAGGRYEYDSFTKSQLSGRLNLTYAPYKTQSFRASIARAVRTPSVIEERLNLIGIPIPGLAPSPPFPPGTPTLVDALGSSNLKPESVIAAEFGYLGRFFDDRVNANLQFYYNRLFNFITIGLQSTNPAVFPPQATFNFANRGDGSVYGLEMELGYKPFDWWRTSVNYTFTQQHGFQTGVFPTNLVNFKNRFMFKNGFSAELLFNYTSPYVAFDIFTATSNPIGHIFRLDARLAQKFYKDRFEISVVGQNLIDSPHAEFSPNIRVDRLIYGMLSFTY